MCSYNTSPCISLWRTSLQHFVNLCRSIIDNLPNLRTVLLFVDLGNTSIDYFIMKMRMSKQEWNNIKRGSRRWNRFRIPAWVWAVKKLPMKDNFESMFIVREYYPPISLAFGPGERFRLNKMFEGIEEKDEYHATWAIVWSRSRHY